MQSPLSDFNNKLIYCGGQISVASLAAVQTGIFDRSASKRRYTKVPVALTTFFRIPANPNLPWQHGRFFRCNRHDLAAEG